MTTEQKESCAGCHNFDGWGCEASPIGIDTRCKGGEMSENGYLEYLLPVKVQKSEFSLDGRRSVFAEVHDPAKPDGTGREYGIRVNKDSLVNSYIVTAIATEKYHKALIDIKSMSASKRKSIFGVNDFFDILALPPEKLYYKLDVYRKAPKAGEIWENDEGGRILVYDVDDEMVCIYYPSGIEAGYQKSEFAKYFHSTGKTCKSLAPFLEELRGLK